MRRKFSIASVSLVVALSCAVLPVAHADCARAAEAHKLKFKVKTDMCVEGVRKQADDSDAETITVCEGDTVEWKVSGASKSVVFEGEESPFDWGDSGFKPDKIEGVVRQGASGKSYKYSVHVKGYSCVHDPVIIVDR